METSPLNRNESKRRFEVQVEGHTAFIEYMVDNKGVMYLTHTEVPPALEGKGVGKALVEQTLQYMETEGFKLAPLCPFVAAYLKRHPDWSRILADGYHIG